MMDLQLVDLQEVGPSPPRHLGPTLTRATPAISPTLSDHRII